MRNGNFLPLNPPEKSPIEFSPVVPKCKLCGDKIPEGKVNVCDDCKRLALEDGNGTVCSWCAKEDGLVYGPVSHGICAYHAAKMKPHHDQADGLRALVIGLARENFAKLGGVK